MDDRYKGIYDHSLKRPIRQKQISRFRSAFRIGDKVRIPKPKKEDASPRAYAEICEVVEIYKHFIVVSHDGVWKEAVNYVDFLTENSRFSVLIASKELSDEYYRLLDEYWKTNDLICAGRKDLIERFDSFDKRLKEIEPLILQSERFSGHRASTRLYGGEVWKNLADEAKKELQA